MLRTFTRIRYKCNKCSYHKLIIQTTNLSSSIHIKQTEKIPKDEHESETFFQRNNPNPVNKSIINHSEIDFLISKHHYEQLSKYKNHDDAVVYIINQLMIKCPIFSSTNNELEMPYFQTVDNYEYTIPFYKFINQKIPIIELLLSSTNDSIKLLPFKIWLIYHKNQMVKLEQYSRYLTELDEESINYYLQTFLNNYEVELFKKYYHHIIINSKRKLSSNLFNSIIHKLIAKQALFENLFYFFQLWINSTHEVPNANTIGLLLQQCYKYGTDMEIKEFKRLINKFGFSDNELVQSIEFQNYIINRDYLQFKKNITPDDFKVVESLCKNNPIEICYSWLRFMSSYSNLESINTILKIYKQNSGDDQLPPKYFKTLIKFYEKHDSFIPLLQLIERSYKQVSFDPKYLKIIVKTFIYSYSRYSNSFIDRINYIINRNAFQLTKISSQFYPYHLKQDINRLKYDSNWEFIQYKTDQDVDEVQRQMDYRVNYGFISIIEKGVRPDLKILLDTFRFTNSLENRLKIRTILMKTRLYNNKNKKLFEIKSMMHPSLIESDLSHFYKINKNQLNDSHKFYLCRILIDYNMYEEAKELLNSIDESYLNSKNLMYKLVLDIRSELIVNNFKGISYYLTKFNLNKVYLSPYLLNQCIYLESILFKHLKQDSNLDNENLIEGKRLLRQFRSFINEISQMLTKEESEVPQLINKTLIIVKDWMKN